MSDTNVKKLLLFGGAFDPPHNGHMRLLQNALAVVQPDLAIVMPTGTAPHKAASRTSGRLRARLCRCFCALDGRVRVSSHEVGRRAKSYTADTVDWLLQRYPESEITLALGGDMLRSFTNWYHWQSLLQKAALFCQCRTAEEKEALSQAAEELRRAGGRVTLSLSGEITVSSTEVRRRAQNGESLRGLVPPSVERLIRLHRLYRRPLPEPAVCRRWARQNLGDKRYQHTLNVCTQALHLCDLYGGNRKKAAVAALLHDYMKETSQEEMLQIFRDNGIINNGITLRTPAVWHGECAALVAKERLGIEDEEVLSAIRCHTCGKAGMSKLDKIIYLADMTSAERRYDGVDELRRACDEDLDEAMRLALVRTVDWLREQGRPVDPESLAALADLTAKKE